MLKQLDTVIGFIVIMSVVSLLIMIATQIVSSVLALRGKNLADSLQALFRRLDPTLPVADVKKLIENALTDPLISDSTLSVDRKGDGPWGKLRTRWMTASAIRPEELLAHLYKEIGGTGLAPTRANFVQLVEKQGGSAGAAWKILSALHGHPDNLGAVAAVAATTPGVSADFQRFEKWFNSAQDRAGQWFAMHTRVISICAAVIAAFALQLDCIALIRKLSSDPDLRAKLIARADAVQHEAEMTANQGFTPKVHAQVLAKLRPDYPELKDNFDKLPANATTLARAEAWLTTTLGSDPKAPEIEKAYEQNAVLIELGEAQTNFVSTVNDFNETGLALVPDPYPTPAKALWGPRHLAGILVSAALLTLGAPFWFNLLKQLTSLRTALADSIDEQPNQTQAKT